MKPLKAKFEYESVYAGPGRRIVAAIIDYLVVLVPLMYVSVSLQTVSKAAAFSGQVLMVVAPLVYFIGMHSKFGATVGKLAVGIVITKLDNKRIGMSEAVRRSSVDILFGIPFFIAIVLVFNQLNYASFALLEWGARGQILAALYPEWYQYVTNVSYVWFLSEFVVILFTEKNRAIHDFIASTVVIHKKHVAEETVVE